MSHQIGQIKSESASGARPHQHHQPQQQQKRSASADLPLQAKAPAVPPKKRARNQAEEAGEADAAAAPLDLSAAGRARSRVDVETLSLPQASVSPAGGAETAAAAYAARCAETLRVMGLTPSEDAFVTDPWTAMGQWQASLHAQYLYYSSLALSGFLQPPPPLPPLPSQQPQQNSAIGSKQPGLSSPGYSGLFAPPLLPHPPQPPPPPPPATSSRSSQPQTPSPARQQPTPTSQPSVLTQQQRRVKATRATPSAATVSISKASPTLLQAGNSSAATTPAPERQPSGETDFQCSCGRPFASLIGLTMHLKETGHGPGAAYNRERDIPKLVRGQDMWINSETEQTREILRCIRCKQSFRTLPDLTMHMMRTRHYTEIIYTDAAPQQQPQQQQQNSSGANSVSMRLPSSSSSTSREERPAAAVAVREKATTGHQKSGRTEVKEADSATDPCQAAPSGATSTLQKMQHFVEASLPRSAMRRPGMFQEVLQNSLFDAAERGADSDNEDEQREAGGGGGQRGAAGDALGYLSPDRPTDPKENPLSSLQKLVDTTEKTSANLTATTITSSAATSSTLAPTTPTSSNVVSRPTARSGSPTEGVAAGSATSAGGSGGIGNSKQQQHTVIMLSPTYIYQGGLYPPFPVCHPSALLAGSGGPMDLSKLPTSAQRSEEATSTPRRSSATFSGEASDKAAAPSSVGSWPESLMQKKAKCHYCSKPFANKGQVRLHVSKGKCPSLLARLPTGPLPPFPYFPTIDYIKAAGRFHAAAAPAASGKELQA